MTMYSKSDAQTVPNSFVAFCPMKLRADSPNMNPI